MKKHEASHFQNPPVTYHTKHPAATSLDVAHRAGVSQSAVSLVFGGKAAGRVGKRAKRAILRVARELGYRPNSAARTLRSGRSRLLVLAVPDVTNPYFAAALQGAEQAARKNGYSVTLATVQDKRDWKPVILDALSSRSVDGFLLFTMYPPTAREQAALRGKAVLVDASSKELPSVRLDIEVGMRAAMMHLRQLRHAKIGHLAAAVDAESFTLRRKAYLDVLRDGALPVTTAYQARASFTIADAFQAARRILEHPDRPSAIVCDSDVLAVGVYKAAKQLQLKIPQDLSVVGIDDSVIARILEPELTTVAIPAGFVGQQALLLLLDVLRGADVPSQSIVPLELVIRGSTTAVGSTQ
jgi:LacI family transcriptional regulator, repressor for deo operon, udp, cdd, tsx, nupC, and nupG